MTVALLNLAMLIGCNAPPPPPSESQTNLTTNERAAIGDAVKKRLQSAYDLGKPDVVAGLMSIYPPRGEVISAAGGRVTASRDTLETGVRSFWETTGRYMKNPRWEWGPMLVEVLTPNVAVLTTTYVVPHFTPEGEPHVIGGAWTSLWKQIDGQWYVVREHLSDMPRAAAERIEATMAK